MVRGPAELKSPEHCNHAVKKVVTVGGIHEIYCLHCKQRMDGE